MGIGSVSHAGGLSLNSKLTSLISVVVALILLLLSYVVNVVGGAYVNTRLPEAPKTKSGK